LTNITINDPHELPDETPAARRARKVFAFIGDIVPPVIRGTAFMGVGVAIFFLGQGVGSALGVDRGFIDGCAAATDIREPCHMAQRVQQLHAQINSKLPVLTEPQKAARRNEANALCDQLWGVPAPVGMSLARYAECPELNP
jgi:hypothetical protein